MMSGYVYAITEKHDMQVAAWYDKILRETLEEIFHEGYLIPRCYAYSFNFNRGEYSTMVIRMDEDSLSNPIKNDKSYRSLQVIEKGVDGTLLGIMFVSEGTDSRDPENPSGFMVVSFEDRIRGWKKVYRLTKQSLIGERESSMQITDLQYDEETSYSTNIPMLEKFSHILRPNYSDHRDTVYN